MRLRRTPGRQKRAGGRTMSLGCGVDAVGCPCSSLSPHRTSCQWDQHVQLQNVDRLCLTRQSCSRGTITRRQAGGTAPARGHAGPPCTTPSVQNGELLSPSDCGSLPVSRTHQQQDSAARSPPSWHLVTRVGGLARALVTNAGVQQTACPAEAVDRRYTRMAVTTRGAYGRREGHFYGFWVESRRSRSGGTVTLSQAFGATR